MRIKRQRRKLRGKYSGNCLSCAAKWSKCWYIASVDNQAEWEARLNKTVTPCDDEVCFQCWDAKIRTSPKRKMNFKAELPAVAGVTDDLLDDGYPERPSKRAAKNKRRSPHADAYNFHASEELAYDSKGSDDGSDEEYFEDDSEDVAKVPPSESYFKDTVILDEENAVLLLSTAFHSIPRNVQIAEVAEVKITINAGRAYGDHSEGAQINKRYSAYYDEPSPPCVDQTPPPSSPASPPLALLPHHHLHSHSHSHSHSHPHTHHSVSVSISPPTTPLFQSPPTSAPPGMGIISALMAQPVVS